MILKQASNRASLKKKTKEKRRRRQQQQQQQNKETTAIEKKSKDGRRDSVAGTIHQSDCLIGRRRADQ